MKPLAAALPEQDDALRQRLAALEAENSALRAAASELQHLIELNPQVMWTADAQGRLTGCSQRWLALTGQTREAALGAGWLQVPHENDRAAMVEAWERAVRSGAPYDFEHRIRLADGSYRWMRARATARRDEQGRVLGWYGATEDIEDRRQAEEERDRRIAQFERITAIAPDLIYLFDLWERRNVYANREITAMLGYTAAEAQAMGSDLYARLLHPEDLPAVVANLQRLMALPDGEYTELEYRMRHADGSWRWLRSRDAVFTREADGTPRLSLGVAQDVTTRKAAEGELQRFRYVVEQSSDFIGFATPEGETYFVNEAGRRMVGLESPAAAQQTRLLDYFAPEDRPFVEDVVLPALWREGRWAGDFRFRHFQTGAAVPVRYNQFTIRNSAGEVIGLATVSPDITERQRAEQALRESQERLEMAQQAGQAGTFEWDLRAERTWLSPNLLRLAGLAESEWDGRLETWRTRVHPDDHERLMGWFPGVFGRREPLAEFEFRLLPPGGGVRWMAGRARIEYSPQGQPLRMLGIHMDVTDRRRTEEALRRSEAELRQLADLMPQIVFVTAPDGGYEWFNRRWYEYTGSTLAESRGSRWAAYFHPDDVGEAERRWAHSVASGEPYEVEYRCRRQDGTWRWFLGRAEPVRDEQGQIVRWLGTCTDVHDRRKAAEAVQNQRQWLEAVLDRLPLPILFLEPGTAKVWFRNRAANEAAGGDLPQARDAGEYEQVYRCWDAAGRLLSQDEMPGVRLARGEELYGLEFDWETPAGRKSLLVEGRILPALHGHPALGLIVFQDVTRLKRIERELRRSNEDLERFAFLAGHDLQEPLRMMLAYAQLLARRYEAQLDGDGLEFLRHILRGGERMDRLIQDLLRYARSASGEPLRLVPTDLNAALALARETLRERIGEAGAVLTSEPLPTVPGVEGMLAQVFQNLVSNALKYARPGVPPRIHVRADREEGDWVVTVEDNGQGIPPHRREQVFGLFTRLHGSDVPGTGIGLAAVKRIVERHGGRVWVESEPGQGSRFRFSVPLLARGTA